MLTAHKCARYFTVKSAVDRVITAMLMVVALPLMVLIGVAIVLFDGRPVFYLQTRVGRNGRVFRIWKFRTMCRDAESATGAVWSSDCDTRVTALGRWLRYAHFDELPQFFNVLLGDMNLIGPRPERPEFVRELIVELPCYAERLGVRPGITGLAQLRFGYDQSLVDVKRKALLDSQYVRTASFFLDAHILLFTIPYVARQVFRRWRAGRRTLTSTSSHSEVVSPASCVSRREPAMVHEFNPHVALVPDTSVDFRTSRAGPEPSP
jgi:lipopolysaccharide/colanic/teichoic acid biosynthesis glycosyltransferase